MSTKSTLLLSSANEHWYIETNAEYYEDTKTEFAIVLEFSPDHKAISDDDGTRLIIEEGSALYAEINKVIGQLNPSSNIVINVR